MLNRREFLELCGLLALVGCEDRSNAPAGLSDFGRANASMPVVSLQGDGFRLSIREGGATVVEMGEESYTIESVYSYPGERIGANVLASSKRRESGAWQCEIGQPRSDRVRIVARGQFYTLIRTLSVEGQRIGFSDELVNLAKEPIGILIRHTVVTAGEAKQLLFAGAPWEQEGLVGAGKYLLKRALLGLGILAPRVGYSAENPTIFVSQRRSHLGVIAEDTVSRLQFESYRYQPVFSMGHLALEADESRTLRWALYPLGEQGDYFQFINRVRRDWRVNFTLHGPWSFFDVIQHWEMLQDESKLKVYLQRTRLKIVAFAPWLDYDNFNFRTGTIVGRQEYKKITRQAMTALKAVDPDIKCLGCMQSSLVSLPPETMRKVYETIPPDRNKQGIYRFTDEQMEFVRELPSRDHFVTGLDGRYIYELYYNGPQREPLIAIAVYAAPGNAQFAYWMDQAKFIMEDVGLDGIYIDQFNLAFMADPPQRYSYDRWDGVTVDIDARTGRIVRRYTDGALVGARARKRLIEYVLSRNGTMVANTYAAAEEVQSFPVMRFTEAWPAFRALKFDDGQQPPLTRAMSKGHLGSPIGLGYEPHEDVYRNGQRTNANAIMKSVITYLRHGLLYYHFTTEVPETRSSEYTLIYHMFPITPIALHVGWIEGKERIVTAVSGAYRREQSREPEVHRFDMTGKEIPADFSLSRSGGVWTVKANIKDWEEVAVVVW